MYIYIYIIDEWCARDGSIHLGALALPILFVCVPVVMTGCRTLWNRAQTLEGELYTYIYL